MKSVVLPCGESVSALGMGTWCMGESPDLRAAELATLRRGLDLGCTLIDTAEMYGEGQAETLVGEAIAGRRDEVFIVSKVYPHHASRTGMALACEHSLRRLNTDRIDLYLLHWRGAVPLVETLDALMALQRDGKIRHFGVSNLDMADMAELAEWPDAVGESGVQVNQLLYNLTRRGIEWDLLPWMRTQGMPLMAYSPMEQARLLSDWRLAQFAQKHRMTPAQVALAWLLAHDDVIAIPKASQVARLEENVAAAAMPFGAAELAELDILFKPPSSASPLEML